MKRFIAISFLLILFSATYFAGKVYYWQMKKIKRQIKKELALGLIDYNKTFVFNEYELKDAVWIHAREFRLNETMYDVYKTDTCDGVLIYHVFQDDKESAWATLLIEHYKYQSTHAPLQAGKDFSPLKYLLKDIINDCIETAACMDRMSKKNSYFIKNAVTPNFIFNVFSPPEI